MSIRGSIQLELQQIVDSIAPIIGVEVAVYDGNYECVAATVANHHVKVGEKVRGHVMRYVMETRQSFINEQPGVHDVCLNCLLNRNCPEHADLSCPISYREDVIGIISFTAFTKEQKIRFLDTKAE